MPETTTTVYTCDKLEGIDAPKALKCRKPISKGAIGITLTMFDPAGIEQPRHIEKLFHSSHHATYWLKRFGVKSVAEIAEAVKDDEAGATDDEAPALEVDD